MHACKLALSLTLALLISTSAQAAATFSVSADCISKLTRGENRFNEKLPGVALKKLARGLRERSKTLQEDPVALLVDYTRPSTDKRAFVVDFKSCDVLTSDYAIHGGAYYDENKKVRRDGDEDGDGVLNTCKNRKGTRKNMTRPGLYVTQGCHVNTKRNWTRIQGDCTGIKLNGLEKGINDDALGAGVVLHELTDIPNNASVKPMGQGCPAFAKGELKSLLRYGLMKDTLVLVHAPQCK